MLFTSSNPLAFMQERSKKIALLSKTEPWRFTNNYFSRVLSGFIYFLFGQTFASIRVFAAANHWPRICERFWKEKKKLAWQELIKAFKVPMQSVHAQYFRSLPMLLGLMNRSCPRLDSSNIYSPRTRCEQTVDTAEWRIIFFCETLV